MMSGRVGFKGLVLVCVALAAFLTMPALAENGEIVISEELKSELANKFSPYLYFHPDETFYPVSPEYTISRSNLNSTSLGLLHENVTAEMLSTFKGTEQEYYLDNRMGTLFDNGIESDFLQNNVSYPPTVYTRALSGRYKAQDAFIIQYWFFYPFNKGPVNAHEGDWEMIMVIADRDANPIAVAYSQHLAGQVMAWADVEKNATHPKVCVALGSHANYFNASGGDVGVIFDQMSNASNALALGEYTPVQLGELGNHSSEVAWLEFSGYWGEYGNETSGALGQRGPKGPAYQTDGKWSDPGQWAEGLEQPAENTTNLILLLGSVVLITVISELAYMKYRDKEK